MVGVERGGGEGKAKACSHALHIRRQRVGAAENGLPAQGARPPGETETRLPIAIIGLVQSAAVSVTPGQLQYARVEPEVRLPVVHLHHRAVKLPTAAEGEGERVRRVPVVLKVCGQIVVALSPERGAGASVEGRRGGQE